MEKNYDLKTFAMFDMNTSNFLVRNLNNFIDDSSERRGRMANYQIQ